MNKGRKYGKIILFCLLRSVKMDLQELRNEINDIDSQMQELFNKRMQISFKVAEYKIVSIISNQNWQKRASVKTRYLTM